MSAIVSDAILVGNWVVRCKSLVHVRLYPKEGLAWVDPHDARAVPHPIDPDALRYFERGGLWRRATDEECRAGRALPVDRGSDHSFAGTWMTAANYTFVVTWSEQYGLRWSDLDLGAPVMPIARELLEAWERAGTCRRVSPAGEPRPVEPEGAARSFSEAYPLLVDLRQTHPAPAPAGAPAPAAAPWLSRTTDEILRDPPREVLDGFGYRRGATWDAFCRELAASVEAAPRRGARLRLLRSDVLQCAQRALATTRS